MAIVLVGLSHKTAPVELREKVCMPDVALPEQLDKVRSDEIPECLIVATCNRVEVLAQCSHAAGGIAKIKEYLTSGSNVSLSEVDSHFYSLEGDKAVQHIFRVASSLDSMMVGEPQILGQIKNAYTVASEEGATGVILNRLMHKAFSTAKRVKTETRIARYAVSISYAAVELAKKIFDDLSEKTVMLVGAGEMSELAARHLMDNGAKRLLVTNRTYSRAVELAEEYSGSAIRFEDFTDSLIRTDIIISSTGASNYILSHKQVKEVLHERRNKPMFLIDIAVPRDLDPEINKLRNVYLYDIDDLQAVVNTNIQERQKEAEKADEIVLQEVEAFSRWMSSLDVTPMIVLLRERLEQIRQEELKRTLPRLNGISDKERKAIDAMAAAIVNKILHGPLKALKSDQNRDNRDVLIEVIREIFRLHEPQ
ncbi:MAG: glutamyl-tRNA reductase [bacterium]|nr:glutamyl-tRNA reductase [bacterium]